MRPFNSRRYLPSLQSQFELNDSEFASQNWLAYNCLRLLEKKLPSVNEIMNGIISFMIAYLVDIYGDILNEKELDELLYNY